MIHLIWAEDESGLIGKNGQLPWHLPNDLKFFKETTLHHTIVMGRKTFEGMEKKLLPNRQTVIITKDKTYNVTGAKVATSIQEILDMAQTQDVYIVGGAQVYALFEPFADRLHQTKVHRTFEGDTYMPKINWKQYQCIDEKAGGVDEKNTHAHTFYTYERIRKEH